MVIRICLKIFDDEMPTLKVTDDGHPGHEPFKMFVVGTADGVGIGRSISGELNRDREQYKDAKTIGSHCHKIPWDKNLAHASR